LIPNKRKVTKDRRGRLRKTDNLLFHMRHEVKGEKKQAAKVLDAAATAELLQQLKQKLKIQDDRQLTWSYLEYSCVYHGIRLNDLQKKALMQALAAPQEQKAPQ